MNKYNRYTPEILRSLGYPTDTYNQPPMTVKEDIDLRVIAANGFEDIMRLVFTSSDGELPNLLKVRINDNTPEEIKQFVNNLLQINVPALQSAPDDETAFATLFPRANYTNLGSQQYRQQMMDVIHRYREEYNSKQQS